MDVMHLICGHMHQSNVLCFVTEYGLNAIKAIYNYNKYNLIRTQVIDHLPSTYLTLSTY